MARRTPPMRPRPSKPPPSAPQVAKRPAGSGSLASSTRRPAAASAAPLADTGDATGPPAQNRQAPGPPTGCNSWFSGEWTPYELKTLKHWKMYRQNVLQMSDSYSCATSVGLHILRPYENVLVLRFRMVNRFQAIRLVHT